MNSKKVIGLAAVLLLSVIMVEGLWAQLDMNGWVSPQSASTAGRYRSAADDFIRPDSYTSAKVENWFAMTSFASTSQVSLGYAKKMESMYIAAFYGGTFWSNIYNNNYTEGETTFTGKANQTVPVYTAIPAWDATGPNNRIGILIGVADMGFRLSFRTTLQHFKNTDFQVTGGPPSDYKSYQAASGLMAPQIAWSMAKDMTDKGIKPYVTVDLIFNRNYVKQEVYTTGTDTAGEQVTTSENNFNPHVEFGLGGYTLLNQNGFKFAVDVDNALDLTMYNNEYSYMDGGKYKTDKIKGSGGSLTERSSFYDELTPSVSGSWSGGPLALKFKMNVPVRFTNTKSTAMHLDGSNKLEQNGADSSANTIGLSPNLRLGAQWKIVPKLALNAGGRINMGGTRNFTTTTGSNYTNGKEDDHSSYKTKANTHAATNNYLYLGASFMPTDNIFFEASTGVSNNASNDINVFDTGAEGLFHFTSLLVGLKF